MTLDENGGRSQIRFTSIGTYYILFLSYSELPRTFTPPVTIRRRNKTDRIKLSHFLPVRVPTALPFGRPCRYLYVAAAVASCSLHSVSKVGCGACFSWYSQTLQDRKEGRPTVRSNRKKERSFVRCRALLAFLSQPTTPRSSLGLQRRRPQGVTTGTLWRVPGPSQPHSTTCTEPDFLRGQHNRYFTIIAPHTTHARRLDVQ